MKSRAERLDGVLIALFREGKSGDYQEDMSLKKAKIQIINFFREAEEAILTQVEKARAEALEEAAKIAEQKFFEYAHLKNFGIEIAKEIRNKLEKE